MYFTKLNYNLQLYIASKVLNRDKELLLVNGFEVNDQMEEIARKHLYLHVPLSKIFNEKYFWKNCFYTNEHTLDPRPETEELIELILSHGHTCVSLMEIGVGTGAVILSLMKEMKLTQAIGIDISEEALKVCQINANKMGLSPILIRNNCLNGIDYEVDILVSNPPYLLNSEIEENFSVLQYDPEIALYGGEDGLFFYKEIAKKQHLFKYIYLEVPNLRKMQVKSLFSSHNHFYMI